MRTARYSLLALLLLTAALPTLAQPAAAPTARVVSLADYGDITTPAKAQAALTLALEKLLAAGGGILIIPPEAPRDWKFANEAQTDPNGAAVTVIDYREGFITYHLPPMGSQETCVWAGIRLDRKLNIAPNSLPHCGTWSNQTVQNFMTSGCSSYMATLTEAVAPGTDVRCYVDLIRGVWVGAFLNITGGAMNYSEPFDRINVKAIGWDPQKKAHYFTADLKNPHPVGAIVYNKHVVNGMQIEGWSNSDNQSMELNVIRHHYAVGDNFVISGMMKYMGDVFSGFGDEGAVVLNAETVGEIDGFHSTVEAVDWARDELTFAPGTVNAQTLSNSRPLLNMNKAKWVTAGKVYVVAPDGTWKGLSNPGRIGGIANVFNYQGGLILGDADCPWDESVIGRFFCLTDDTETILAGDPSPVGGYAQAAGRPIYRWYMIREFTRNADGTKQIKILRVRWSAVAAGAPRLFRDDNYTRDGHEKPMTYAIAPGAWVYDVSQGFVDCVVTGGWVGANEPRKLKLAAGPDRNSRFDFEKGDAIEQACGPDPWQPRPLRIRQFDQMPSTMPSASIEVQQLGRVQVPTGLSLWSMDQTAERLSVRKDQRPPYDTLIDLSSCNRVGIDFAGESTDSAIFFRQPGDKPQVIRWRQSVVGSSSLAVDPASGTFELRGGSVDVGNQSLESVRGVSATDQPAKNLRGIDVAVPAGATQFEVKFATPEADAKYAVAITPGWLTTLALVTKTPQGFTLSFGTAAPANAKLDWVIVR